MFRNSAFCTNAVRRIQADVGSLTLHVDFDRHDVSNALTGSTWLVFVLKLCGALLSES